MMKLTDSSDIEAQLITPNELIVIHNSRTEYIKRVHCGVVFTLIVIGLSIYIYCKN